MENQSLASYISPLRIGHPWRRGSGSGQHIIARSRPSTPVARRCPPVLATSSTTCPVAVMRSTCARAAVPGACRHQPQLHLVSTTTSPFRLRHHRAQHAAVHHRTMFGIGIPQIASAHANHRWRGSLPSPLVTAGLRRACLRILPIAGPPALKQHGSSPARRDRWCALPGSARAGSAQSPARRPNWPAATNAHARERSPLPSIRSSVLRPQSRAPAHCRQRPCHPDLVPFSPAICPRLHRLPALRSARLPAPPPLHVAFTFPCANASPDCCDTSTLSAVICSSPFVTRGLIGQMQPLARALIYCLASGSAQRLRAWPELLQPAAQTALHAHPAPPIQPDSHLWLVCSPLVHCFLPLTPDPVFCSLILSCSLAPVLTCSLFSPPPGARLASSRSSVRRLQRPGRSSLLDARMARCPSSTATWNPRRSCPSPRRHSSLQAPIRPSPRWLSLVMTTPPVPCRLAGSTWPLPASRKSKSATGDRHVRLQLSAWPSRPPAVLPGARFLDAFREATPRSRCAWRNWPCPANSKLRGAATCPCTVAVLSHGIHRHAAFKMPVARLAVLVEIHGCRRRGQVAAGLPSSA